MMEQNTQITEPEEPTGKRASRPPSLLPSLSAAIICTALIAEAIRTALTGRDNGDLMVLMCPLLGAIFLSIPATQAWIRSVSILRRMAKQA